MIDYNELAWKANQELYNLTLLEDSLSKLIDEYYEFDEEELRSGELWYTTHDLFTLERAHEIAYTLIGKSYVRHRFLEEKADEEAFFHSRPDDGPVLCIPLDQSTLQASSYNYCDREEDVCVCRKCSCH